MKQVVELDFTKPLNYELLLQVLWNQSRQHRQPDRPQLNDYEYKFQDGDAAGTFQ